MVPRSGTYSSSLQWIQWVYKSRFAELTIIDVYKGQGNALGYGKSETLELRINRNRRQSPYCKHKNNTTMRTIATELPAFISEGNATVLVVAIVALFSAATVFLMINDYRLYLEDHLNKKYCFTDFVKREQFYIYLLLFFFLQVITELWMRGKA